MAPWLSFSSNSKKRDNRLNLALLTRDMVERRTDNLSNKALLWIAD